MKAAVLEKLNYPLAIREIFPTQLLPGQVYVKVLASGLVVHSYMRSEDTEVMKSSYHTLWDMKVVE